MYNRGRLTVDSTPRFAGTRPARAAPEAAGAATARKRRTGRQRRSGRQWRRDSTTRAALSVTASTIYGEPGRGRAESAGRGAPARDRAGSTAAAARALRGAASSAAGGRLTVSNSTLAGNFAGAGGAGGGLTGPGGTGGNGGGGRGRGRTAAWCAMHRGRQRGSAAAAAAAGLDRSQRPAQAAWAEGCSCNRRPPADDMRLQNTIVASSVGSGCAGSTASAIADRGHDLSYGDRTCPGRTANPKLGPCRTTVAPPGRWRSGRVAPRSTGFPPRSAGCPSTDQRGVRRPQRAGRVTSAPTSSRSRRSRSPRPFRRLPTCGARGSSRGSAATREASRARSPRCKGSVDWATRSGRGRVGTGGSSSPPSTRAGSRVRTTVHYDVSNTSTRSGRWAA